MKRGLLVGGIAWATSLLVMPLLAPLLFPGGDLEALGRAWLPLSLVAVGVPAFLVGYRRPRRKQ